MVSIDWLEMFCQSRQPIEMEPEVTKYSWERRAFGSKMWKYIFDVYYSEDGGTFEPFAVVCSYLHGKVEKPWGCSVKIHNEQLYKPHLWERVFDFLSYYDLQVMTLSRVDLAADFLYLYNRVSGKQLIDNLKSLRWWKCGTSKVSEHYYMPYSLGWAFRAQDMDVEILPQGSGIGLNTESMTFGSKACFAQVCLYDKTAELKRHEVDGVCNKEYIRDCWKQIGVFDEKRHTWRIEIRLNSKALTLACPELKEGLRPVQLADLMPARLYSTFKAAVDVWFRLVDASQGCSDFKPNAAFIAKYTKKKCKFQKVKLFAESDLHTSFCSRPHQATASRFIKSMINRLEQTAHELRSRKAPQARQEDPYVLTEAADVLKGIFANEVYNERVAAQTDYYSKVYCNLLRSLRYRQKELGRNADISEDEIALLAFLTADKAPLTLQQRRKLENEDGIVLTDCLHDEAIDQIIEQQQRSRSVDLLEFYNPYQGESECDDEFMKWYLQIEQDPADGNTSSSGH